VFPASVQLEAVYGFIDEYGDKWQWDCGQIVRNPLVIEMLQERAAPFKIVEKRRPLVKKMKE
jgi:hypothetical protein